MYKLSPSDFKYLWEECKHCYYKKIHEGVQRPSTPIPSIFNRMSGLMQKSVQGRDPAEFIEGIPPGEFIQEERPIRSQPLPSGKTYLAGRLDLLVKFEDGTHGVIDLKMTDAKDDDLQKFDRQLHAYKYALENPYKGEPLEVSKFGLFLLVPTDVKENKGDFYYKAKPVWKEINIDMDNFYRFIEEVEAVIDGPEPEPSSTCDWCKYKHNI